MKNILERPFEILSVYIYIKGAGWTLLDNGYFGGLCTDDRYRFEKISDDEYWVYYREPDDKQFKVKIRALSGPCDETP